MSDEQKAIVQWVPAVMIDGNGDKLYVDENGVVTRQSRDDQTRFIIYKPSQIDTAARILKET